MSAIPVSARLASIALRLEPKLEAAFWRTLSVLFLFFLGLSDTWAVANYPLWAIFRVFYHAVYPFLAECKVNVRGKAWGTVRRELRILSEIPALLRRGASPSIWTEISNVLQRLGGPETRKDAREIYEIVAKPEVKADAQYKLILGKVIASLVEQLFFEFISAGVFAGIFRLWNGPVKNWDFSGRNFYLFVKTWRVIGDLRNSRDLFPRRTNFETNWTQQEQYFYTPLKNHGESVRLLVLHPRIPLSDVRCSLFEVSLDNVPSYEAISYTWGDASIRENIWVNGKRMNVPKSTYTVLSNRSSWWRPKILWMDAICINQQDEEEKGSQVGLMREIYIKAFIVSVCLQTSPAPEGALPQVHEAKEALLAADMINELAFLDLKTYASEVDIYLQYAGYIRHPRWLAFLALWFTRIWVVQEVTLASSIRVFYGRSQFSWEHLVGAIATCIRHPSLGSFLEITKDPLTRLRPQGGPIALGIMNDFRKRFKDNDISFTSVLYDSNMFNATDARDYVFGLHGFYNGKHDDRIHPNYKKSEAEALTEVYKNVAQYLLDQDQPLRLLSYAGVGFFANNQEGLPSWCPNWSRQPLVRILSYNDARIVKHYYHAGGSNGRKPECSEGDQFALVLQGRILDSIVSLGPPLTALSFSNTLSDETWNVNEYIRLFSAAEESWNHLNSSRFVKQLYPHVKPPQHFREAFWRTLIGNKTDTKSLAPSSCAISFEKWVQFGRDMLNRPDCLNPNTVLPPDLMRSYDVKEMFATLIPACGLNRRLCITENGYIGMVPPLAVNRGEKCEGDVICLIRGAQVPFVLRPVTSIDPGSHEMAAGRRRFQLVGEAYIHGIMDGEMARWEDKNSEESIEIV
ncbi:hypothetical protein G7Y89_g1239 [Cudoniella acicularis]|uniref:Heterokaryon incompatibility domain-containing protein n=1 Tax=Cudoniella acicularis TaxID=354080 RepID=A0A8H4RVN6_9HELO|nr:hypothetical protein G7Y89_g1239 [Cudoniella acicularis]